MYYQVWKNKEEPVFFDKAGNIQNAEFWIKLMFKHHLNIAKPQIKNILWRTHYSSEYGSIQKYLPVYQIQVKQDDTYFFTPVENKIVTWNSNRKTIFLKCFSLFHKFEFLNFLPKSIAWILFFFIQCFVFIFLLSGIYLLFKRKHLLRVKNKSPRQKWIYIHRWQSLFFGPFILLWLFSGTYHFLHKEFKEELWEPKAIKQISVPANISCPNKNQTIWKDLRNTPFGRICHYKTKDSSIYLNPLDKKEVSKQDLALSYWETWFPQFTMLSMEEYTRFKREYGFIQRRLPVWKITTDKRLFFLDIEFENVDTQFTQSDFYAAYIFRYLHKWHFLNGLGKKQRDLLLLFACLGGLSLLLFASLLLRKKSPHKESK